MSEPVLLRSYPPSRESPDLYNVARIWEVARATSAATTFFEPIRIGRSQEEFVDGGLGTNNPVEELWQDAADAFCNADREKLVENVCSLVSIGTGIQNYRKLGDNPLSIGNTLIHLATETENTAEAFRKSNPQLYNSGRLFRFNVGRGLAEIGLEEASEQSQIKGMTDQYLRDEANFRAIRQCAEMLGQPILPITEGGAQSMSE